MNSYPIIFEHLLNIIYVKVLDSVVRDETANFDIKLASLKTVEISVITGRVSTPVFQSAMTVEQRR